MSSNQTHLYPLFIFVLGSREMGNGKWEMGIWKVYFRKGGKP